MIDEQTKERLTTVVRVYALATALRESHIQGQSRAWMPTFYRTLTYESWLDNLPYDWRHELGHLLLLINDGRIDGKVDDMFKQDDTIMLKINEKAKLGSTNISLKKYLSIYADADQTRVTLFGEIATAIDKFEESTLRYNVLSGRSISEFYRNMANTKVATCMTGDPQNATDLYARNPDKVKLVAKDFTEKTFLFKDTDGKWIADRTYGSELRHVLMYCFLTGRKFYGLAIDDIITGNTYFSEYFSERHIRLKYDPLKPLPYLDNLRQLHENDMKNCEMELSDRIPEGGKQIDVSMHPIRGNYPVRHRSTGKKWSIKHAEKWVSWEIIKQWFDLMPEDMVLCFYVERSGRARTFIDRPHNVQHFTVWHGRKKMKIAFFAETNNCLFQSVNSVELRRLYINHISNIV